jgi:excinuclease ABC subunit B
MYADRVSDAMRLAIEETTRRREIQVEHNRSHGITPRTITKAVQDILSRTEDTKRRATETNIEILRNSYNVLIPKQRESLLKALEAEMLELAKDLEFERAAVIRDEIQKLRAGEAPVAAAAPAEGRGSGPPGRRRARQRR